MHLKKSIATFLIAASVMWAGATAPSYAQSEASAALSMLPLASLVSTASVAGGAASAAVALPVALSVGGAVLIVKAVEVSGVVTVVVLERASDGARASVRMAGAAGRKLAWSVGQSVAVSVLASGVVLSAAGEVLAFVPNALGRALLHNEKLG